VLVVTVIQDTYQGVCGDLLTFLHAGQSPFSSVRIRCQQKRQIWNTFPQRCLMKHN